VPLIKFVIIYSDQIKVSKTVVFRMGLPLSNSTIPVEKILPEYNFERKGARCPGFGEGDKGTTNLKPRLLDTLLKIAEHDLADTVSVC
jgi:hypothetical protein